MTMPHTIRDVELGDEPALGALERAAPDSGAFVVQLDLRIGYLELVARYPNVHGYVAVAPVSGRAVGMLFSSVAPIQWNGSVVPGVYLFSLRVHPSARRQGVATALIERAWARARADDGAEVAWAGVMDGNRASARTFARAGFAGLSDVAIRMLVPAPRFLHANRSAHIARAATPADLPALAEALNRAHAAHNLWRPVTVETLTAELLTVRHTLDDVHLVLGADQDILAAGAVFDIARVAGFRLLGHRSLPTTWNRALARLAPPLPIRPVLLRQRLLCGGAQILVDEIRRRTAAPLAVCAIVIDPRDPAWRDVAGLPGLTRRLHVLAKGRALIDDARPLLFA
jgi:ribosomal protein S18 acetylase RimI-like enzyme